MDYVKDEDVKTTDMGKVPQDYLTLNEYGQPAITKQNVTKDSEKGHWGRFKDKLARVKSFFFRQRKQENDDQVGQKSETQGNKDTIGGQKSIDPITGDKKTVVQEGYQNNVRMMR
jgi:hypothetical protein